MRRVPTCVIVAALAVACSDLSPIPEDVCGNGAIDVDIHEECDGASALGTCGSAADPTNACHFICGSDVACPAHYACGSDARCRLPSGMFRRGPGPFPFEAAQIRGADVDGDGITDLIGVQQTQLLVRYGDASAPLSATTSQIIATPTGPTTDGDLDGDHRFDVLVPTAFGLVTMLGSAARGFTPVAYDSLELDDTSGGIIVTPVSITSSPFSTLLFGTNAVTDTLAGGATQTFHDLLRFDGATLASCLDGTLVDTSLRADPCAAGAHPPPAISDLLGGQLVVGRTGFQWQCDALGTCQPGPTSVGSDVTDEIAIVVPKKATVTILSAAVDVDGRGSGIAGSEVMRLVQTVSLKNAGTVTTKVSDVGTAAFGDLDGDGQPDLLIPTVTVSTGSNGTSQSTLFSIAYGSGDGTVIPAVNIKSTQLTPLVNPDGSTVGVGRPDVVADLDGDGFADLVTAEQIFVTDCATGSGSGSGSDVPIPCRTLYSAHGIAATPREWSNALAVDVNGDGRPDLVGFVAGEQNVDVLINAGDHLFNHVAVITDEPVETIVAGDFDGDLVDDFAIVSGDATLGSAENDGISIVFGSTSEAVGAPVPMGQFGLVESLAPASIALSFANLDAIADLVVVNDLDGHRRAATLIGNTSRQLVAPFGVSDPSAFGIGAFDAGSDTDVLAIDGAPEPSGLSGEVSLLSGTGGGDLVRGADAGPILLDTPIGDCFGAITCSTPAPACPPSTQAGIVNGCYTGGCIASTDCSFAVGSGAGIGTTPDNGPIRGLCGATISTSCTDSVPACPAGTRPGIKSGCWDGYCLTEAQCPVLQKPEPAWFAGRFAADQPETLVGIRSLLPPAAANAQAGVSPTCAATDIILAQPPLTAGGAWSITLPTLLPPALACQRQHGITSRDLDGDGVSELLIAMCADAAPCAVGPNYLVSAQGGVLDFDAAVPVPPPAGVACARTEAIDLDGELPLELVGVCSAGSDAATWSLELYELGSGAVVAIGSVPIDPSDGRFAIGDFNGDKLEDVAVTSGAGPGATVQVYLQCSADDRDGCSGVSP